VQRAIKKDACSRERGETHFSSNKEKDKCIEYFVERETAGARKRVEDAEAAVQQEQENMENGENAGFTNREPKIRLQKVLV
jgi:hypothetical protein